MVSFLVSTCVAAVLISVVFMMARRREPGTPLTWGEALVAGVWVFAIMMLIYGIIPHHWLAWADNGLGWRSDVRGIPIGPFNSLLNLCLLLGGALLLFVVPPLLKKKIGVVQAGAVAGAFVTLIILHAIFAPHIIRNHRMWSSPKDISFLAFIKPGRGKIQLNAQLLRDIIAVVIYAIAMGGNIAVWLWWQKRKPGDKPEKAVVAKESAFGRPVVEGA